MRTTATASKGDAQDASPRTASLRPVIPTQTLVLAPPCARIRPRQRLAAGRARPRLAGQSPGENSGKTTPERLRDLRRGISAGSAEPAPERQKACSERDKSLPKSRLSEGVLVKNVADGPEGALSGRSHPSAGGLTSGNTSRLS